MKTNPRSIEMVNRLEFANVAFKEGYLSFLPIVDEGIDLVLYRECDRDMKLVQLKTRWVIDRKYSNRNIWMAFSAGAQWYLAPHDEMLKLCDKLNLATTTKSWTEGGAYSTSKMSKSLQHEMAAFIFPSLLAAK